MSTVLYRLYSYEYRYLSLFCTSFDYDLSMGQFVWGIVAQNNRLLLRPRFLLLPLLAVLVSTAFTSYLTPCGTDLSVRCTSTR